MPKIKLTVEADNRFRVNVRFTTLGRTMDAAFSLQKNVLQECHTIIDDINEDNSNNELGITAEISE